MDITTAIKHAMDGNAVLFLGAGFSIGGTNRLNQTLPTAKELSYQMCEALALNPSDELPIVSERFIDDKKVGKGIDSLISFLKDRLICTSTTYIQDIIAGLPWLRIYTTNYDNIFEISSRKLSIEREIITATLPKKSVNNLDGAIVHMNGNIIKVTPEKFYDEFKITNKSYLKQGFLDSPWGDQFIHDINNCKAIVFVGYSLKYDLELQKIMHNKIYDKAIFVDRKDDDGNQEYLFSKWGEFYPIESKGFSDEIISTHANYTPEDKKQKLNGIQEILISDYINSKITPNDVLNLLVYGKYNSYYFRNTTDFYLKRKGILDKVKSILELNKICLIHSNLGNGKSILLQYLASQLIEENNIYFLNDVSSIQEDLSIIKARKSSTHIIFIDNYDLHLPIFRELSYDFPDNIKIIATTRTSLSDILIDHLENDYNISLNSIGVVNIEIISDEERKDLISLLDKYNFWGSNSSLSTSEKNNLINRTYQNRLSSIFYMLLDSNVISEKMNIVFNDIKNLEVNKYLLSQSICNICSFKLKGFEIAHLANINYSEIEKSSLSQSFKEIFLRTADDIELRSTIFSQYIIRTTKNYALISELLTTIYINSFSSFSKEYGIVRKKLISRSNLIEIYGGRKRNTDWKARDQDIYNFYSTIQVYSKTNPFFWLQYGITALNLNYHPDAKIYFNNAYSYAEQLENFDSFQLDTHYARFLLTEILNYDVAFDFDKLCQAHRLLMDNSNAEIRLSYVLRQIGIYSAIDKKYENNFSAENRLRFITFITEIVERFHNYFSAIERKKRDNFFFAVDKPVRGAYKTFHHLLKKTISESELKSLDNRYNKLVNKYDKVR
jgi:hypothetical protein